MTEPEIPETPDPATMPEKRVDMFTDYHLMDGTILTELLVTDLLDPEMYNPNVGRLDDVIHEMTCIPVVRIITEDGEAHAVRSQLITRTRCYYKTTELSSEEVGMVLHNREVDELAMRAAEVEKEERNKKA